MASSLRCSGPSGTDTPSKEELGVSMMQVNGSIDFHVGDNGVDHADEVDQVYEADRRQGCDSPDRLQRNFDINKMMRSNSAPPLHMDKSLPRKSCLKKPGTNFRRRRPHRGRKKSHRESFEKMLVTLSHLAGSLASSQSSASRNSFLRSSSTDLSTSHTRDSKRGSHKSSASGETAVEVVNVRFDSVNVWEFGSNHETDQNTDTRCSLGEQTVNQRDVETRPPLSENEASFCRFAPKNNLNDTLANEVLNHKSYSVDEFEDQRQHSKRVKDTSLTMAQRKYLLYRQGFTEAEVENVIAKQRVAQQRRKDLLEQMRVLEENRKVKSKKQLWEKVLSPLLQASSHDQAPAKFAKARKRCSV